MSYKPLTELNQDFGFKKESNHSIFINNSTTSDTAGATLTITAGSATVGNANGGSIIINPGLKVGSGTDGYIHSDGYLQIKQNVVDNGQTKFGVRQINTTAATVSQAQYSPLSVWRGEQWRTDLTATRTLEAGMQLQTYSFGSISGELSHYFRENNTGSWKYFGGFGTFGTSAYIYLQNDTEGGYLQTQVDASGAQIFSNRQLAFAAGDDTSTDPAISFAAADGSITTRFMSFFLPSISGITAEYRDLEIFPNNVPVTFNATGSPTITNQRQFYFGRRKFGGSGGTTTLTNAATVAIQDAPFADSGVTITNGYALLVEAGATYLKGDLKNDGYQKVRTVTNNSVGGDITNTRLTTNVTQTTDATQTTAWSMTLAATTVYWIEARVIAFTSGSERAMYGKAALVYRDGGGATIQTGVQDVFTDVETTAGMDATFTVSSNDVRLSVTGVAATTMNWVATITYQAVNNS